VIARKRPHVPDEHNNGADREQDAECNCATTSNCGGASLS